MSSAVNSFVQAIRKRSKKCLAQKVACFGSLRPIPMIQPPLDSSWVALQYEPGTKFSIEQFPSYTQLNIGAKITILHINPVYNVLMIINQDKTALSLDHARLPWLLKLFEGFLDHTCTTCSAQPQPAPMIIHVLPAQHNHSCWEGTASDRSLSQLNQSPENCTPSGTVLMSLALHTIWTLDTMYFLALWCSTDLLYFYECAFMSPVCVWVCVRKEREGGEREGGRKRRGWVTVYWICNPIIIFQPSQSVFKYLPLCVCTQH